MRKICACLAIAVHTTCDVDPAKIHILVLDRNTKSAHSIGQILKSIGYQVFVSTYQAEAIGLVEEKLFNVVVKAFDPDAVDAIALMDRIRAITPDTSSSAKRGRFKSRWTPSAKAHTTICRNLSTRPN